jgi:hypothetical protein
MSDDDDDSVVSVLIIDETEKAYLFHNEGKQEWFPKSEVHFESRNIKTGKARAIIPDWLMQKKGWEG